MAQVVVHKAHQEILKGFFHSNMGDHLAADLAESTKAIGDLQEAIRILGSDIAGGTPDI